MMAAKKKKPEEKGAGESGSTRSLKGKAEELLASSRKISPTLKGQTPEELIHDLRVHQIELEMQAEELRGAKLALEESRDNYIDLYEFAPLGYLTLNDKALVTAANLTGATLLGIERSTLIRAPFSKFIAEKDSDQWHRYFVNVRKHDTKQICTLTLKRGDGSVFPARLEGVRISGSGGAITVRIAFSDITDIWQIEALRGSEERYRTIYDQSPIAIELFDSAGILVHANPACLNLFGIVDIQAIQNFSLFADPNIDDEHKVKLHQKEPVHYQGPFDFEKVKTLNLYPTSRNGIIWLDVLITPLGSGADSITGFLVQIQDITERKRAEEDLRESKALVDTVVENVPLMIFLKEAKDLRFVIFNRAGEELLGYDRKALLGKNNLDLFPPEQAAHFMTKDRDVLDGELNLLDIPEESILTAKKGLRLLHTRKVCIRAADGTTKFLLGISEDITERKRAEETLRETTEYLQKLIDFSNAPIIVWDPDFRITRFNHACEHLTGRTEQEVIGQPLGILFPKKTRATSRALIKKTLAGERWEAVEIPILASDGTIRTVLWNTANILTADAKLISTIAQGVDITERKQAADTIALTTRKLTLMNDVTYQYIQNKVTGLRGYADLSKDAKTEAERLSFIEKEEHVLADIHHLIKNTQEYQEIGLLLPRWIPVEQSIRIAVSRVSPKEDISVESALHGLELYSDPLIEKIFANLIENAVLHGKTTRRITFSCHENPDGLILICEDDGVGISPKDKARLFDRLVSEKIRFGLFFIRECLVLSGMTIAETGEPGKGARFEITVPKGAWRMTGKSE